MQDFKDGVSSAKRAVTERLVLPSQIQKLPPREAYVFLTGQQAVVKTNIGCKRMYLEETERQGAQLAGAFELRSGLTLERTASRHPWIPQALVTPAPGDTPPQDGGGIQLKQPEREMQEE